MGNDTETTNLRHAALEHVMRSVHDPALVAPFAVCEPGTPQALSALGRLVSAALVPLDSNSPLVAFCANTRFSSAWRDSVPAVEQSLWGELLVLRSVYGDTDSRVADPLEELMTLRSTADADFEA